MNTAPCHYCQWGLMVVAQKKHLIVRKEKEMNYRELIVELLTQATDEQLKRLYYFVKSYVRA